MMNIKLMWKILKYQNYSTPNMQYKQKSTHNIDTVSRRFWFWWWTLRILSLIQRFLWVQLKRYSNFKAPILQKDNRQKISWTNQWNCKKTRGSGKCLTDGRHLVRKEKKFSGCYSTFYWLHFRKTIKGTGLSQIRSSAHLWPDSGALTKNMNRFST